MCFSPEASFAGGIIISTIGLATLKKVHKPSQISGYHIVYKNNFPRYFANYAFALYLIATITPLFVSSITKTHLMGVLMFLSCLITAIFFTQYLTSVCCFFAALLSGVIYWILSDSKKEFKLLKLAAVRFK